MTNKIMDKQYPGLEMYQGMRVEIMEAVNDEDLSFQPENCPSLGELCLQIGEWQQAYVDGFRNFEQNFGWRHTDPSIQGSAARLLDWYAELDAELKKVVAAIPDYDVDNKPVERGGWTASVTWNLDIFKECLVIFYSKCWVYFKLMGKPLTKGLDDWLS